MTLQTLTKKLKPLQGPVQNSLFKWLYLHLPPRPITSRKMHRAYATAVSILLREREMGRFDRASSKAVAIYLKSVTPFIDEYEKNEFPVALSSPEDVLRFLMEQNDLTQYDLASDLGGQPVVSDILRGKRRLSREQIERLSKRFCVTPATFFS